MALTDAEFLEANAHITDAEIAQDIADTEKEIDQITHSRAVALSVAPRLAIGRAQQIRERKELIKTMKRLQRLRSTANVKV